MFLHLHVAERCISAVYTGRFSNLFAEGEGTEVFLCSWDCVTLQLVWNQSTEPPVDNLFKCDVETWTLRHKPLLSFVSSWIHFHTHMSWSFCWGTHIMITSKVFYVSWGDFNSCTTSSALTDTVSPLPVHLHDRACHHSVHQLLYLLQR